MVFRRWHGWVVAALALLAATAPGRAEEPHALRGVALVIGQSDYQHIAKLPNPENDARAIEEMLAKLGFETDVASDRDAKRLKRDLEGFVEDAEGADVALIYYSGHGIEAGGENFLVPVDADVSALEDAGKKLVPLSKIVAELKASVPVTIVLLDACRNDPFPPGTILKLDADDAGAPIGVGGLGETRSVVALKDAAKPTASSDESLGQIIGFAAEPGKVALDGPDGGNSPYAAAILRHMAALGGEEFGTVLRMIGEEVYLKTGGKQRPWVNESLRRLIYFGVPEELPAGGDGDILTERRQLLVSIAALPDLERRQIETIARDGGVPMDALYAMLKTLGADKPKDAAELDRLLRGQTERLKQLLAERAALTSTDPEIARLSALADQALADGALEAAKKFSEQAKARVGELSTTVDKAEADLKARRLEFAAVFEKSARTYALAFDYRKAAEDYGKAFEQADRWDENAAVIYKVGQADALSEAGNFLGDNALLNQAIEAYEAALARISVKTTPMSWAAIQNNLARTLATLGEAETGRDNLDRAAVAYQQALTVYTRANYPNEWASTTGNLGTVYWRLGQRETAEDSLRKAVALYRSALDVQSPTGVASEWAATQTNLGSVLAELGGRETTSDSFRAAIDAHRAALTVYTRDSAPLDWALGQVNLGASLSMLGEREASVETLRQAIEAFNDAAEEMTTERAPAQWATIQKNLSATYLSLANIDGSVETLTLAKSSAEAALTVWTRDKAAAKWADGQAALGSVLFRIGEKSKSAETLKLAADAYSAALGEYSPKASPIDWASLQHNLGGVYDSLSQLEAGTGAFEQAAAGYRAALTIYTPSFLPKTFGDVQYELGNSLSDWGERAGDNGKYLEAIDAYQAALTVRSQDGQPEQWAKTQSRLGFALSAIGTGQDGPIEALDLAVAAYREALTVQTQDDDLPEWTATQFGLGYTLLAGAERTNDAAVAEAASEALTASLNGYPRATRQTDWAKVQDTLGRAYFQIGQSKQDPEAYRKSADSYRSAIDALAGSGDPLRLASAQSGLGGALLRLGSATGNGQALADAVAAYRQALSATPRESRIDDWTRLQMNLANALWALGAQKDDVDTLRLAALSFQTVQSVRSREAAPEGWAQAQEMLARVLGLIADKTPTRETFEAQIAANRALADFYGRDRNPERWASFQNDVGYALMLAGRVENNPARFEEAVPILRDAVAVQKSISAIPAVAFTEDSLCDALTDLGAARKDRALAQEAIAACESALVVFRDKNMAELVAGSETNLKEAQALLASLP